MCRFAKPLAPPFRAIAMMLAACLALAPPYATCLTNHAGTISFRRNESANSVQVVWNGGARATTSVRAARGFIPSRWGGPGRFKWW